MARAKAKSAKKTDRSNAKATDAIALLKADHRQVEEWFEQFDKARDDNKRQTLATKICSALKVHMQIEEEIFYPAYLEATKDEDLHHEAAVEHGAAKKLIAEIEASSPDDDYFKAKVTVLSEMIKHHVKEEEQSGGMFAESRESEMDLKALGEQMAQRKAELEGDDSDVEDATPPGGGGKARAGSGRTAKASR